MKTRTSYLAPILLLFIAIGSITSCKKGEDDPAISLRSRKARFANTWTLVKYEKNGVQENMDDVLLVYEADKDGSLKETAQGAIFGTTVQTVRNGTWDFVNDKEDVRITIESDVDTYEIQRLANNELWLKEVDGSDTYVYYFDGK
jgi:hypothetical protein